MEFEEGSHVSGMKSPTVSTDSKLFDNVGEGKEVNMKMELEEESLANRISGMKSPTVSTDSKLFDNAGEGKEVNIKMELEEESLANRISGMKSPTVSTDSKLFDNAGEGKEVNIKMDLDEESLANRISRMKSPTVSTDSKLFDNVGEGKEVNIKFQAVQKHKKEKVKRKITEDNSSVRQNKIQKLRNKIDAQNVEPVAVKSNAVKCLQGKKKKEAPIQSQEEIDKDRQDRTIFVGNVPIDISRKKLCKLFNDYGKVDCVRIRCPPLADPRVPKKVAVIRKNFHSRRKSVIAFVRFAVIESARKALAANGRVYQGHHIRVDMASTIADHDPKKAVFIGNVPFGAEEDDLRKIFKSCGKISSIRVVRDRMTGIGKGFGYINFQTADAVELALKLYGEVLNKRELRVTRYFNKPKPRNKSGNRKGKTFGKNRNQELKMSSSKTKSNEEDNIKEDVEDNIKGDDDKQDVVNVPDSDERSKKTVTKSQQAFSLFQGQKMAEYKQLRRAKELRQKRKIKRTRLRKNARIRRLAAESQSAIKEVKKPVLETVISKED